MNHKRSIALLTCLILGSATVTAHAQSTDPAAPVSAPRSQIRMETKEFLQTHRWDEPLEQWVLRSGVEPPQGVMSRAEVKAKRDEFLRTSRWDAPAGMWVPRKPAPVAVSSLTRAEMRSSTTAFMRTHHWDEETEAWLENRPAKSR